MSKRTISDFIVVRSKSTGRLCIASPDLPERFAIGTQGRLHSGEPHRLHVLDPTGSEWVIALPELVATDLEHGVWLTRLDGGIRGTPTLVDVVDCRAV